MPAPACSLGIGSTYIAATQRQIDLLHAATAYRRANARWPRGGELAKITERSMNSVCLDLTRLGRLGCIVWRARVEVVRFPDGVAWSV